MSYVSVIVITKLCALCTFFLHPHDTAQIMGVTSVYTVNNQQKVCSVNAKTCIFKNWVQWGDIILNDTLLDFLLYFCGNLLAALLPVSYCNCPFTVL